MRFRLRIPGLAFDGLPPEPSPQDRMFAMVNDVRILHGWKPYYRRFDHVAQIRTDDMVARNYFGHTLPEGGTAYVAAARASGIFQWDWLGENLAMNNYADPVAEAMKGLMNSPTHRANILEPSAFDSLGIGVTKHPDGRWFFAQFFSGGVPWVLV
jgi:uncharacterized protein YkwD